MAVKPSDHITSEEVIMLKVHGVHGSPFVRKVLITLEVKGLDYEMGNELFPSLQREWMTVENITL